jgi:intracellular sulfur oxidation DsrE/DsrF family protein
MKLFSLILSAAILLVVNSGYAQDEMPAHIKDHITYPALDFHEWVGVMPIKDAAMRYNPELDYKVALDLYGKMNDSTQIHAVILEVARTYNLLRANGVPAEKIQMAAVIHGGIVRAILKEEQFQKDYKVPNPNLAAIKALEDLGVKFYVCGQSVVFNNISEESISPLVKLTISAKTTFISLDQMGFSYLNLSND